jgi:hypothetical protein
MNKIVSAHKFRRFGNLAVLAIKEKGLGHERDCYVTVRRLQRAELFDDQEQEDHDGPSGIQEVLQAVPQAHGA